ncbi:uncharacterized protein LOC128127020 [Lactuca sativa]|uniref:uncharacterized protein LOC128127020 n=1 Tax=Lactuca sativa TaxID=4236 RepID=UPI0022B01660|nr:uncharacterized protein LOC128127020 [Lactuca sativa]
MVDKEIKKDRYHEMLRSDIQQFVSRSSCMTLEDMIARAKEREIDLEMERKRKSDEVQTSGDSSKRPKVSDSRSRGHRGRSRCGKCDKAHDGPYVGGDSGCFKCGQMGHYSKGCIATTSQGSDLISFHCNQRGHKKAHCPSLASVGPVSAPDPMTLQITESRQVLADAPVVKSRAFLLTAEEARVAPDVVMGSLPVNGISALTLFD